MKSSLTIFAVLILVHGNALADNARPDESDTAQPSTNVSLSNSLSLLPPEGDRKLNGEAQRSLHNAFVVRLYKEPELSKVMNRQQLGEVQSGVVVDYFPFANGFHVSAGTFKDEGEQRYSNHLYGHGRAYVGVGWKKLLDSAQQLDLNIDVGTYLGTDQEEPENYVGRQEQATGSVNVNGSSLNVQEKPVIRLGLEFRF